MPPDRLPLARYRLEFAATTPLSLPAYAGSTLRGAWGAALRRVACVTREPTCDDCPLLMSCSYARIFETRPPRGHVSLQDFSQVPKPYVIEPPLGERLYAPGEKIIFHIVLVGRALDALPLILWAHIQAFRRGVGKDEGRAELLRVVHEGIRETTVLEGPEDKLKAHDTALSPAPRLGEEVTLRFITPLRLQADGRRATAEEMDARRLLMALVRRIRLLCEFHGPGRMDIDQAELGRIAESIMSHKNLSWYDWQRYSNRQRQKIPLGGVVGEWRLVGELAPFAPFLYLGQWLHVGKEATFGMGGYQLEG